MTTLDLLFEQFEKLDDTEQNIFLKMLREHHQLKRKAKYDKIVKNVEKGNCISGLANIMKEVRGGLKSA